MAIVDVLEVVEVEHGDGWTKAHGRDQTARRYGA